MKRFKLIAYMVFVLALAACTTSAKIATCTGADPCKACKNCKYCKHCAKEKGTCGICKKKP